MGVWPESWETDLPNVLPNSVSVVRDNTHLCYFYIALHYAMICEKVAPTLCVFAPDQAHMYVTCAVSLHR